MQENYVQLPRLVSLRCAVHDVQRDSSRRRFQIRPVLSRRKRALGTELPLWLACVSEIGHAEQIKIRGPMEPNESRGSSWQSVPMWNGKPESFAHFIHEVKWTLTSSRKEDRALLAAKIVRRALQGGQPTLVQLLYKLDPEDFRGEEDVQKLIRFLEESPLNRQPLPDAGAKIGAYYRRLGRRPGESVPAFLVREDKVHDEMLRALQRLLREKELTFDGYDMSMDELKAFCGIPGDQSMYFSPDEEEDFGDAASERAQESRSGQSQAEGGEQKSDKGSEAKTGDKTPKPRGKDLIERLLEKGLLPLAALDVIRGWLILDMSTMSEDDRRLIRAATRNKLGYHDVRNALLSMYEDTKSQGARQHGHGHAGRGFYPAELWEQNTEDTSENDAGNFHDENFGDWWEDQWCHCSRHFGR